MAIKILICEDDADARNAITNILKKRDYAIEVARDGEEAITQARSAKPDIILLDIRMPKIDGIEAARDIRKFNKEAKIIFITAFKSQEMIKEASKYSISDYITKPLSAESLLKAIEKALAPQEE